jgi:hypothetical protein
MSHAMNRSLKVGLMASAACVRVRFLPICQISFTVLGHVRIKRKRSIAQEKKLLMNEV